MNKIYLAIVAIVVLTAGAFLLSSNKTNVTKVETSTQPVATSIASPSAKAEENTVTVTANGFEPQTITVKVGSTVTWINKSGTTVIINSDPHPIHNFWPFLNLGSFADGGSVSATFQKSGTYTYHNHLDPSQKGTVIAQ